jgi:hypothetical protein
VPVVAIVEGVKVMLFFADHQPPHFHVEHGGQRAQIMIETLDLLAGELQPAKLRAVRMWARPRRRQLLAAWKAAIARRNPGRIE